MKRLPLALVALVVLLIAWTARPLKSREWDIEFDTRLQNSKDKYLASLRGSDPDPDAPNVILIVADDLGLTDISLYGSPFLETPNIDSIGLEGLTCTEAYSTAPISSPSRAGMLTGRYQNRYGFDSQPMTRYARTDLEWWIADRFVRTEPMYPIRNQAIPYPDQIERQGMPPNEILISEALSASSYSCDAVGKWHLGYGDLQYPLNRGFESFYGFLEAYGRYIDPDAEGVENWQFDEFSERHIWRTADRGFSVLQRNGEVIDENAHLTDAFAREAVDRIALRAPESEPYFLYLPFSAPHTPFQALEKYTRRFAHIDDPRKRIYYAMIAQLDDAVGDILEAVEKSGEAENTIVVFTSDNGGATYTGATGNDPLRGGKMSHFEGGLAVPLMIRWPREISRMSEEDAPVIHLDLFHTIREAAGIPLPGDRVFDGTNLLAEDFSRKASERPLFWRSDYNLIIRYQGWKLMVNRKDGRRWLYNLDEDREENHNLIDLETDKAMELESLINEWDATLRPPAWPRVMDYFYDENGEGYWFAT